MAVVDADDGEVGGVHQGDGGEGAEIHQQFAIAGDAEDALVGLGQGEAEGHGCGCPHGAGQGVDVGGVVGDGGEFLGGAGEAADAEEVLRLFDEQGNDVAAVKHGGGEGVDLQMLRAGHGGCSKGREALLF